MSFSGAERSCRRFQPRHAGTNHRDDLSRGLELPRENIRRGADEGAILCAGDAGGHGGKPAGGVQDGIGMQGVQFVQGGGVAGVQLDPCLLTAAGEAVQ